MSNLNVGNTVIIQQFTIWQSINIWLMLLLWGNKIGLAALFYAQPGWLNRVFSCESPSTP